MLMHWKLSWYFALIFAMIQQQATGRWPLKCTRSQGRRSLVNCCSMATTTTTTTTIRTTIWATMWGNNNKQLHENCQRLMFIGIRNRPSSFHLVHIHTHTHTKIERERHAQPMSDAKWKASRDSATATTTTTTSSGARLTERCCEWQLNHLHF